MFFDFNVNSNVASNNKFDSNKDVNDKTSINATIVTKISLNKKDRVIASKIANCRKSYLLNKRFKIIQKAKRKKKQVVYFKELHVSLHCCLRQ